MKIAMDRNIRAGGETFARHGEVLLLDGRGIGPGHVADADVLIVRSVTRVDAALLAGSTVGFVGSTTIGTDHLDTVWLEENGVRWANAPGCNADSAAQYTLAILWLACERLGRSLPGLSVGIIGRGNVGTRVQKLLQALGCRVVANDPPLADAGVEDLVTQKEALAQDVVCLHVPLTRTGPYPTNGFIGSREIDRMPPGALLVNAARGGVVDGAALTEAVVAGRIHAALDVWPGEPNIAPDLLAGTIVATPHVAGYSDDGKRNGTWIVYAAFCRWAGLPAPQVVPPPGPAPRLDLAGSDDPVGRALDAACFVRRHDAAMRNLLGLDAAERAAGFDRLRRDYPSRRDFQAWTIACSDLETARLCRNLGFTVTDFA